MSPRIRARRVYEPDAPEDGKRILVDRLWPRGLRKDAVRLQHWARDLAPSDGLRRWFGHDPGKWDEFRRRYADELGRNPEAMAALVATLGDGPVTLLHAARDTQHNNAVALKEYLERRGVGADVGGGTQA